MPDRTYTFYLDLVLGNKLAKEGSNLSNPSLISGINEGYLQALETVKGMIELGHATERDILEAIKAYKKNIESISYLCKQ